MQDHVDAASGRDSRNFQTSDLHSSLWRSCGVATLGRCGFLDDRQFLTFGFPAQMFWCLIGLPRWLDPYSVCSRAPAATVSGVSACFSLR